MRVQLSRTAEPCIVVVTTTLLRFSKFTECCDPLLGEVAIDPAGPGGLEATNLLSVSNRKTVCGSSLKTLALSRTGRPSSRLPQDARTRTPCKWRFCKLRSQFRSLKKKQNTKRTCDMAIAMSVEYASDSAQYKN